MANTSLEKLWMLAQIEADKRCTKPEYVFGEVGLYLKIPPVNQGYYPTPINTSTFAETQGDSVHYGLMRINGNVADSSPVIMTVPCNYGGQTNFVLGENLLDFLRLGCEVGYFSLEQLAYRRDDFIDYLSHPDREECEAGDQELLDVLRQSLSLKPWGSVQERLEQLHEKYHSLLELPPGD